MRLLLIVGAAAAVSFGSAASAMPVATFLGKAQSLKSKGPLAMFSGDLKLLMNQIKQDSTQLRAENQAAAAAGKPKAYCTPAGYSMGQQQVLEAMQRVPAAQRSRTSTKDALRAYLAGQHPCR